MRLKAEHNWFIETKKQSGWMKEENDAKGTMTPFILHPSVERLKRSEFYHEETD